MWSRLTGYFTEVDPDEARLARQQVRDLRDRGLARVMSSDAHSPDKVGLDRSSRTLMRLRLDQPAFPAIWNAIVNSPRALQKPRSCCLRRVAVLGKPDDVARCQRWLQRGASVCLQNGSSAKHLMNAIDNCRGTRRGCDR